MTSDSSTILSKVIEDLNAEQLKLMYQPISLETATFSVLFRFTEDESLEEDTRPEALKILPSQDAILYGEIKRTCYVAYAKYQYHAWVKLEDGIDYPVDEISAKMNSGNGSFSKTEQNASSLKKLDEVYQTGNACQSAYMLVTARKGNATAGVEVRLK